MDGGAVDGLTPAQTAAAVKEAIGGWGFTWRSDPGGRARGRAAVRRLDGRERAEQVGLVQRTLTGL